MTTTLLRASERPSNFAKIMPLLKPEAPAPFVISKPRPEPLQLIKTTVRGLELQLRTAAPKLPANLKRLETNLFTVLRTSGTMSRPVGTADLSTHVLASLKLPHR